MLLGTGLMVAKVVHDMSEAEKNDERAERITLKAANNRYAAEHLEKEIREKYNNSVSKLANRKRAVLKSSFPRFKEVYTKIININFDNDTRGIKELFSIECINEYNSQIEKFFSVEPMKLTDKQLVSSFVVEGSLGLLLGGLGGGLMLGASGTIVKESELNVTMAKARKKQAMLYAEAVGAKQDAIDAVCWHFDQVSDILAKLNVLFLKSIKCSNGIIDKNGYASENYSETDLTYIGTCMNLAKAIKSVVDTPLLDEENQVIKAAKDLIIMGHTYVEQFSEMVDFN